MYQDTVSMGQAAAVKFKGDLASFVVEKFPEVAERYRNLESAPEIAKSLGISESYKQHSGRKLNDEIVRRGVLEALSDLIPNKNEREKLRKAHQSKAGKLTKSGIDWDVCNVYGISLRDYAMHLAMQTENQYQSGSRIGVAQFVKVHEKIDLGDFGLEGKLSARAVKSGVSRYKDQLRRKLYQSLTKMAEAAQEGDEDKVWEENHLFENLLHFSYTLNSEKWRESDNARQSFILGVTWMLSKQKSCFEDGFARYEKISKPK